jgi:hypothetical protein
MHIIHPTPGGFIRPFRIVFEGLLTARHSLHGQLGSATITGQITDSSRSTALGASVVAVDSATGATLKAKLNGEGTYVLTKLPGQLPTRRHNARLSEQHAGKSDRPGRRAGHRILQFALKWIF